MPKLNSFTLFSHELHNLYNKLSFRHFTQVINGQRSRFFRRLQLGCSTVNSPALPQRYFFLAFLPGTFPPARRASDSPMAMACFRLVTFFPERPLFKVPLLRSRIALLTFSAAFLPYLAIRATPFKFFNYSLTRRFDDRVLFNNSLD